MRVPLSFCIHVVFCVCFFVVFFFTKSSPSSSCSCCVGRSRITHRSLLVVAFAFSCSAGNVVEHDRSELKLSDVCMCVNSVWMTVGCVGWEGWVCACVCDGFYYGALDGSSERRKKKKKRQSCAPVSFWLFTSLVLSSVSCVCERVC